MTHGEYTEYTVHRGLYVCKMNQKVLKSPWPNSLCIDNLLNRQVLGWTVFLYGPAHRRDNRTTIGQVLTGSTIPLLLIEPNSSVTSRSPCRVGRSRPQSWNDGIPKTSTVSSLEFPPYHPHPPPVSFETKNNFYSIFCLFVTSLLTKFTLSSRFTQVVSVAIKFTRGY